MELIMLELLMSLMVNLVLSLMESVTLLTGWALVHVQPSVAKLVPNVLSVEATCTQAATT